MRHFCIYLKIYGFLLRDFRQILLDSGRFYLLWMRLFLSCVTAFSSACFG
ncbi:hypothetical protein CAMSH0001_2354 [Campylobacter showae RM3277]|uniref:Uncharacterized protein n=1 Tax=Campylobacter showae RM3277 TaxID=553219 RepID=C6RG90_9BACT|nr:hypothetical protein CAMSH0001_2354 [Campylobacter showae RM3277]